MDLVTFDFRDEKACLDRATKKYGARHPQAIDHVYRLRDFNEHGRRGHVSGVVIQVQAFPVLKKTPKGVKYLDENGKLRLQIFNAWVSQRVFRADQTGKMIDDFRRRKACQKDIAQRSMLRAERCLELISLKGRRPKGLSFDSQFDPTQKYGDHDIHS